MATYEEIYGKRVKEFDSDPTLNSSYEGQVWYDKATGKLKSVVTFAAWHASTPQIVGGYSQGSAGTATSMISVGRDKYPSPSPSNRTSGDCEEWNGSGYSTIATNPNPWSFQATCGTSTAAITACGSLNGTAYQSGSTLWNGTSWTSNTAVPTAAEAFNQFGTQTASIGFGGGTPPGGYPANAYTGDGEGWTAGPNLSNDKRYGSGCTGTQTAGIAFGGQAPTSSTVEELDGTTWSSATAMPTTGHNMPTGIGAQDSAFALPGVMSPSTSTFKYDGTSWTADASTATPRPGRMSSAGDQTACLISGAPSNGTSTEEYNLSINTITSAAWASGGNLNTARSQGTGAGTMTAGWVVGGSEPSLSNKTEEYNGTSWTAVNNLGMSSRLVCGAGLQTAAFATGGFIPGPSVTNALYNYDGTDWTSGAAQPVGTYGQGSLGTQTAGLAFGGSAPTTSNYLNTSYEYDGEGWAASPGNLNQGRHYIAGSGTQTAGLAAGGDKGPAKSDNTEEYNGSSWTAGATMPDVRRGAGLSGPQTAALLFGGSGDPGARTTTFGYDGTSWSTRPSISTSRRLIEGGSKDGSNTSAWMAGGQLESPDARSALTEEFTGETETATAKTLTTS